MHCRKSAILVARSLYLPVMTPEEVTRHCQMALEGKGTPGRESPVYSLLESLSVPLEHWPQCIDMCLCVSLLNHFMYLTVSVMKAWVVLASHPYIPSSQGCAWLKAGFQEKCTLSEFGPKKGWVRDDIFKSVPDRTLLKGFCFCFL